MGAHGTQLQQQQKDQCLRGAAVRGGGVPPSGARSAAVPIGGRSGGSSSYGWQPPHFSVAYSYGTPASQQLGGGSGPAQHPAGSAPCGSARAVSSSLPVRWSPGEGLAEFAERSVRSGGGSSCLLAASLSRNDSGFNAGQLGSCSSLAEYAERCCELANSGGSPSPCTSGIGGEEVERGVLADVCVRGGVRHTSSLPVLAAESPEVFDMLAHSLSEDSLCKSVSSYGGRSSSGGGAGLLSAAVRERDAAVSYNINNINANFYDGRPSTNGVPVGGLASVGAAAPPPHAGMGGLRAAFAAGVGVGPASPMHSLQAHVSSLGSITEEH